MALKGWGTTWENIFSASSMVPVRELTANKPSRIESYTPCPYAHSIQVVKSTHSSPNNQCLYQSLHQQTRWFMISQAPPISSLTPVLGRSPCEISLIRTQRAHTEESISSAQIPFLKPIHSLISIDQTSIQNA